MIVDMNTSANEPATFACPPRPRVMVLGPGDKAEVAQVADQLRPSLQDKAEIVAWDLGLTRDLSQVESDLAIVLGGDGSILRAAHQMGMKQVPVIGVNLGKLGFLADLSPEELLEVLPAVCTGKAQIIEHLMFECTVSRAGKPEYHELGLNEVAVLAGAPFSVLDVHLYVDAELATTYSCDGLIVSTPVGSTAHSLSAGGPILRKDLQAFVISPISPHTLTNRPVVDAADRVYELTCTRPHAGTSVVVDGRVLCTLSAADRVRVERSAARFKLLEVPGRSYYRTLRDKLGWGGRLYRGE